MSQVKAPWTPRQVEALQLYQDSGLFHPFTCGDRGGHPDMRGDKGVLVPTVRGWICQFCDYTQDWAHPMMADLDQMQAAIDARKALFAGPHDHQ